MNLAEHLMALTREATKNGEHSHFHHRDESMMSIDSISSLSDDGEDDFSQFDNVFSEKGKFHNAHPAGVTTELATILASNRILAQEERDTCRPKQKNIYVQQRIKHHSGGNAGGSKKMATAWKRITEKFQKPHKTEPCKSAYSDSWRRHSLDVASMNASDLDQPAMIVQIRHAHLTRLLSLERDEAKRQHRQFRPRSNSEVSHYKIVSKHAENAEFIVNEPSKLADASALCKEYFSRLTCYDAVPCFTTVIAVDKRTRVASVFNAFCVHNATAVLLWDTQMKSVIGTCHVDDLVCQLWGKARKAGIDRLFDVDGDFDRGIGEFCEKPSVISVPAETSLMEAARVICVMDEEDQRKCAKRLALENICTGDVVHLLSAWDILHFFSRQMSKYRAAHTAFDGTLASILAAQLPNSLQIEVLPECTPLKEAIGRLATNEGGSLVCYSDESNGKLNLATLSFVDIIQYVIDHGSWNEADASNKLLGDVLKYHTKKESLVFDASTPLFAVLNEWTPSMTADTPVVVVDSTSQNVLGLLEPEHLLQALLLSNALGEQDENNGIRMRDISPVSTRL